VRKLPDDYKRGSVGARVIRIDMLPDIERSNYLIGKSGDIQWVQGDLCGVRIYAAGQYECPTFHRDELEEITTPYYQYCPECKLESVVKTSDEWVVNRSGTDGWGQPVRFSNCSCGGKYRGWLDLNWYTRQGEKEDDPNLHSYLKGRIDYYYECFSK
jgi:hypothetical protein